ncbi:MAG: 30S ribosomal protein S15 [Candidatus Shikimatogenerans sp. Ttur]|uniref:30S ribosomal protein S15 n=1 Tax=Candidatus Shikimatogenerans sp. Ttur TaxID=3158569 RepID=A0AAU7ZXR3_9FLAO
MKNSSFKVNNKFNYQLKLLFLKIKNINKHLLKNKKDFNSKKILLKLISKKKKMIYYFKHKKNDK